MLEGALIRYSDQSCQKVTQEFGLSYPCLYVQDRQKRQEDRQEGGDKEDLDRGIDR
jgi:hypothetical protein